eukprot:3843628-Prymnesium_polylepis.1
MRRATGSGHTRSRSIARRRRSQISRRCSGAARSGSASCASSRSRAKTRGSKVPAAVSMKSDEVKGWVEAVGGALKEVKERAER